ncbi:MAG: hypothetical protein HZB30_04900 [Nitrospirae bacterium]|nr:hypothetical protein [Nitrospirota bacterium]
MSIKCKTACFIGMFLVVAVMLFPLFQTDAEAVTQTLTIVKTGSGTGTVSATNIDCGLDCTEAYDKGTSVVLTATADTGSLFKGWIYAGILVSKNSTYTVKMGTNKTIKAKFLKTYNVTITNTNIGTGTGGTVTASGISCGSDCDGTYVVGKTITLTATPSSDSKFSGWSVDVTKTKKTIDVTISSDMNITATFDTKAQGLQIAEKVSVVDTSSSPGGQAMKLGDFSMATTFPDDSDFSKDQTNVFVNERAAETFGTINEILCMIGQTKYDEMVNKGSYKAQIDKKLCSSDNDDPSSAGQDSQNQSSGSTMPDYEMWTVNSSRTDDISPQIVKVWIHESAGDMGKEPPKVIFAKAVITEGTSNTNPYGLFTMNFKMSPEIDGVVAPITMGKGLLKSVENSTSGKVLLKFAFRSDFNIPGEGSMSFTEKATLDRTADGSSGGGTVYNYESNPFMPAPKEETFDFAFDSSNFLRVDGDANASCMDRTAFDETAWRYGLYDSNGARLNRDSGFPIKTNQGGKDYYGWIGYYGIWFPRDVTLNNGDQVYKMGFGPGSGEGELYNVLISGGKLKKHVRKEMTLGDIKNVPMDYRDNSDNKNYRVKWDGTNFMKAEWLDDSGGNFLWKKLDPQVAYDISALNFDMLNFWSQSLGGNVQIKLNCSVVGTPPAPPTFTCSADDTLPVAFYAESVIFPSDTVPSNLACFTNCPDLSKINIGDQWPYNNTYGQPQGVPPAEAQYISYGFNSSQMVLTSDSIPVLATGDTYQWGVMSGPLFEPTPENLALLACDWNPSQTCGWQVWNNLPEFYTWETGPNDWNKFTALVDPSDSSVLKFDPPLQVSYVHTWDDLSTSMFNIEYSGFGNLQGIPGKCIDWDSGNEVECGEGTRWIPQFSIAEGSEVTDVSDGVTKYYVKPLEKEQRMKQLDSSFCSALTTTTYSLPSISEWVDPNIGTEPVVEGAPNVIGGVVQQ